MQEAIAKIGILLSTTSRNEESLISWDMIEKDIKAAFEIARHSSLSEQERQISIKEGDLMRARNNRIQNFIDTGIEELAGDNFEREKLLEDIDRHQEAAIKDVHKQALQNLRKEVNERSESQRVQNLFNKSEQEIKGMWAEAQEKIANDELSPQLAVWDFYDKARQLSVKVAGEYPDDQRFIELREQAALQFDEARKRADLLTTAMQLGNYDELILELLDIAQEDQGRQVEKFDEQGISQGKAPVMDVIEYVKERATIATSKKINEQYLVEARKLLAEKNPQASYDKLQEALNLQFLSDEVRYPIEDEIKKEVEPQLNQLRNANRRIDEALNESNLIEALNLLKQSHAIYEWAPRLRDGEARKEIIERMKQRVERLISDARNAAEKNDTSGAENYLGSARQLTEVNALDYLNAEINKVQQLVTSVIAEGNAIPQTLSTLEGLIQDDNFTDAQQVISTFVAQYPGTLDRQPGLRSYNNRVDARLNVESISERAKSLMNSGDISQIGEILEACKTTVKENTAEAKKFKVEQLISQLEPRYNFLLGKQAWNNYDIETAKIHLERVINDSNAFEEDKASTAEMLSEIQGIIEQDIKITATLERAEEALMDDDQNQQVLIKHYDDIFAFHETRTTKRDAYEKTFYTLGKKLEDLTRAKIEDFLADESSLPDDLEQQWDILSNKLQSPYTLELDRPIRLSVAKRRGKIAKNAKAHETVYQQYAIAMRLAPDDKKIHQEFESAYIGYIRDLVNRCLDDPDSDIESVIKIVRKFENESPESVEAKILLSKVLLGDAKTKDNPSMVRSALVRTIRVINRADETAKAQDNKDFRREISQLTKDMELANTQASNLTRIEAKIHLDTTLITFHGGVDTADTSLAELQPHHYIGLEGWWETLKEHILGELNVHLDKVDANDFWLQFPLLTKISILQPENQQADQLNMAENRMGELFAIIQLAKDDRDGATYTEDDSARNALNNQIAQTERISRQINDIQVAHKLKIVRISSETLKIIRDEREALGSKLGELRTANEYYSAAMRQAEVARRRDSWGGFEDSLGRLESFGYSNHVIMNFLEDYRIELEDQRARLLDMVSELKQEFSREKFPLALQILDDMRDDDEADTFGLQSKLTVDDPYKKGSIRGASRIRNALESKIAQIEDYRARLSEICLELVIKRLQDYSLADIRPYLGDMQDNAESWIELGKDTRIITAESVIKNAHRLREESRFDQAISLLQSDLKANDTEDVRVPATGSISLRHAEVWFRHQLVDLADPESYYGALFITCLRQLSEATRLEILSLSNAVSKIEDMKTTFIQKLDEFDNSLDALTSKRANADQLARLQTGARNNFALLKSIVPNYTGLMKSVEDYRLLAQSEEIPT